MADEDQKNESALEDETTQSTQDALMEDMKQALAGEKERADTNMAGWQRAAADLANYRRRNEQERSEQMRNANADLIRRLLPVVDDMERAFQTAPADVTALPWVDGMRLIERKFLTILEQEGVTQFDSLGQTFDPVYHEAITFEPSDPDHDGKVIGEVQKGYRLRDRVLRPAMVRVGRGQS